MYDPFKKYAVHAIRFGTAGLIGGVLLLSSVMPAQAGPSGGERQEVRTIHRAYQEAPGDALAESAALQDVLRYGMHNSASLKAAFYRWKNAFHNVKEATALDDPQFSFRTFIDGMDPREEMFTLEQMFPFPGKRHTAGKAATAVSRQRYADYQKVRLELFYEIKDVYFEYWFLHKNILVVEKNIELMQHFEKVAQSKYKSGLASNHDLLRAQVELGKLENERLTLNDYRAPVAARLNAVLSRRVSELLGWPEAIDHHVVDLNPEAVLAAFHRNNPDLQRASERIEEARNRVLLARLDYLPDVTVGFDYINNGTSASALMFKVNLPLWYGKQRHQLKAAQSFEISAAAEREQLEADLAARVERILFDIRNAARQINLYRDALVPIAEQSLKASETGYQSGSVDFLSLIDAERTLLEFQLAYYKSIRNYEQQLAQLEMIVGEPLREPHNER